MGVVAFSVAPAFAQAISDSGTTVNIAPGQANCTTPLPSGACFQANGAGSVLNSNGNAVQGTLTSSDRGAAAYDGGTINLNDGATFTLNQGVGLSTAIGAFNGNGTINGTNVTINGTNQLDLAIYSAVTSAITLSGTTTFGGTFNSGIVASGSGATVTFNGPVLATGNYVFGVASADTGGQVDFNQGGTINVAVTSQSSYSGIFSAVYSGTINLNGGTAGLTGHVDFNSPFPGSLLIVEGGGTINAINSKFDGANTGGKLYGILATIPGTVDTTPNFVSLNNSTLTLNSAGHGILAWGVPVTVTLTNNSAITAFGDGASGSLALITNSSGVGAGTLTLNATDSTLSGNVLVDAAGAEGANAFAANFAGTTRWDGNLTNGAGSTANVALSDSARWTGAAINATNIGLGSGTTWSVTGDSTVTGAVTNGGLVAFTSGGPFKMLTTANYIGNGGTLGLNTALGGDGSPTDQLIINGGTATGTTGIVVTNAGGAGALTTGNGIPIVVPTGGATIAAGAFGANGSVVPGAAAGLYQYLLFQGTGGDTTYYLRSHCIGDCTAPPPVCIGSNCGPPPCTGPDCGPPTPIYRPDVSVHSVLASMARQQELATLGTFHERNGDQRLATGAGTRTAAWGRVFGQLMEQSYSGTVSAHLDGEMGGLQAGVDALQWVSQSGHQDRFGLFAAYARTTGDVRGHALGTPNRIAGQAELDGTSFGGYWTHLAPTGWYTDTVVMSTRFDGGGNTVVGTELDVKGYGVTASVEGGYPIAIAPGVRLEPQGQLVYSHVNIDDVRDPHSYVAYDTPDALFGRLGLRLSADMLPLPMVLRPYLKANLWQDFTENDTIRFEHVHQISSRHRATTLELGGGMVWQLSSSAGLWFDAGYTTDIGGSDDQREAVRGTAGLRIVW
jgi:outer membrane autotransporter protein